MVTPLFGHVSIFIEMLLLWCVFFFLSQKTAIQCFGIKLIHKHSASAGPGFSWCEHRWKYWLAPQLRGLCAEPPPFDGAHRDHDYYLARAASLRCLETCFPKETTEGQLLSAELFRLLSMCVLAAFLWPTDPDQQHETGPHPPPSYPTPQLLPISAAILTKKKSETHTEKCSYTLSPLWRETARRKLYGCKFWFLCAKQ